jgi:hypothetical protein
VPANGETKTVDASQFAALCNLFCLVQCDGAAEMTAGQIGDVLLYNANPVVCDQSRLTARAVLAYLGLRSGIPEADELITEVHAAMRNGEGSLPDTGDEAGESR